MIIQINTDNHIEGRGQFESDMKKKLSNALARFEDQITRVEVHFSDENAGKFGLYDKRCLIEVRLRSYRPVAVTEQAATLPQALTGALEKIKRMLDEIHERRNKH